MTAFQRFLVETGALTVVGLVTFWWAPALQEANPTWPPFVHYAIPTVVTAVGIAAVRVFVLVKAHVSVDWMREGEGSPVYEIDADVRRMNRLGTRGYEATVEFQRAFGLGWVALHLGARCGVWIRAEGVHAQLRVTRVWQDGPDDEVRARSGPRCSAELRLVPPVAKPNTTWNTALFRFDGAKERSSQPRRSAFQHNAFGTNAVSKLCAMLIVVDSKSATIVERWS